MEFCERDYTQMRITPFGPSPFLPPSLVVYLSRSLSTWKRKGRVPTLSQPRRYASPFVCAIGVGRRVLG